MMETRQPSRKRTRPRWIARLLVPLALITLGPLWLGVGCQSKLIYFPRPYPPDASNRWQRETVGKMLDFKPPKVTSARFYRAI